MVPSDNVPLGRVRMTESSGVRLHPRLFWQTYCDKLGLEERVVYVTRREESNGKSDERVFVRVVEGIAFVSMQSQRPLLDTKLPTHLARNSKYSATLSKRYSGSIRNAVGASIGSGNLSKRSMTPRRPVGLAHLSACEGYCPAGSTKRMSQVMRKLRKLTLDRRRTGSRS